MKNTKRSITLKIVAGYLLAVATAVIAFWVIYQQLDSYSEITERKNDNNKKLAMVGEAITGLYEAESLTRNIIQTSDTEKFSIYKAKVDSIINTINQVSRMSFDALQSQKIDSIKALIDSKNQNFEELIEIYEQQKEKGVYATAIDELKKANESFGDTDYDKRFRKLSPEFKKRIVNIINLTKKDNAKRLTNQTIDSIAQKVKQVLADLEKKDTRYKQQIKERENKLLKNDQTITRQLRDLMAAIEDNERNKYLDKLSSSDMMLSKTSNFIILITVISLLIAIIFLFLITKDVSMSQKYRNELEEEKAYTESLLKTRESLINTVTHDLRSPLNTVIGYSDLLEKTGLNAKQKHYLDHLKKSSDYILHLVNDLLDLSKLEAGKMVIEELPFSPHKLIENTITSTIPIHDPKNLEIAIRSTLQLQQQFLGDPFRIKQILTNLVNNAYKFTNQGGITVTSKIVENGLAEKQLVIAVQDTGIGITTEQQQFIFEEFSQGEEDTEKKYGGFGLGLSITKKIIKLLDGTITLDSEVGKGSTFTIHIPIRMSHSLIAEESPINDDELDFSNRKVLIVDDDPSQLDLTSEVVSMAGLSYEISRNGIEALELLQKNTYDLVLSDIQMPGMDGFELLEAIQNTPATQHLQVIALSGRIDVTPDEYLEEGFAGSLRKPYLPKDLINLIASILHITPVDQHPTPITTIANDDPSYSLDDLMIFAQGDTESLRAILDTFIESTQQNLVALQTALDQNNKDAIHQIAHRMLPMFKQIKAHDIIPILDKLEHQTRYELDDTTVLALTKIGLSKIEVLLTKLHNKASEL